MWESSASNQLLINAVCCNLMQMSLCSFLQKTRKPISSNMLTALLSKLPNEFGRRYLRATSPDCRAESSAAGTLSISARDPWLYCCIESPVDVVGSGLDAGMCRVRGRIQRTRVWSWAHWQTQSTRMGNTWALCCLQPFLSLRYRASVMCLEGF